MGTWPGGVLDVALGVVSPSAMSSSWVSCFPSGATSCSDPAVVEGSATISPGDSQLGRRLFSMLGIGKLACACALCHVGSRADDDLMVMVSERRGSVTVTPVCMGPVFNLIWNNTSSDPRRALHLVFTCMCVHVHARLPIPRLLGT